MTTSRTTFIPLLALAGALTGCGDDATTAVSRHQTGDDAHDVTFERDAQGRIDRVAITGPAYD